MIISSEGFVVANKKTEETAKEFVEKGDAWFDFGEETPNALTIGVKGSKWKTVTGNTGYEIRNADAETRSAIFRAGTNGVFAEQILVGDHCMFWDSITGGVGIVRAEGMV